MKNADLNNKTTEELQSELKIIKAATGALIGVLIILFAVTIYGILAKENNATFIALIAAGISISAIPTLLMSNMKKIKTELETRKEND